MPRRTRLNWMLLSLVGLFVACGGVALYWAETGVPEARGTLSPEGTAAFAPMAFTPLSSEQLARLPVNASWEALFAARR